MAILLWLSVSVLLASGDCIRVKGDVVRAADFAAEFALPAGVAPQTVLLRAPAAGRTRPMPRAEVEKLFVKNGIDAEPRDVCIERVAREFSVEEIHKAMRSAFPDESVEITILDFSSYSVPYGDLEFSRSGLMASSGTRPQQTVLWRGKVLADRTVGIWARVRLREQRKCVVAAEVLEPGQPIPADRIRLEEREFFPLARPALQATDEAIGRAPVRRVSPGAILDPDWLRGVALMQSGAQVEVEVREGAVMLRVPATAEADGDEGDRIWFRTAQGVRIAGRVISNKLAMAEERTRNVPQR